MLPMEKVVEIHRLLSEGKLTHRSIALQTRVSRGTVSRIASGKRGLFGREQPPTRGYDGLSFVPERCPGCGGLVRKPCVLCRARRIARRERAFRLLAKMSPKRNVA